MLCKTPEKAAFKTALLLLLPSALLNSNLGHSIPVKTLPVNFSRSALVRDTADKAVLASLAAPVARKISLNRHVASFVKLYIKKEAEFLAKMEIRSDRYFPVIEKIFNRFDLPVQLKYLAIVESKLNPKALSPAGARGLWQLMPFTARDLGLKVTGKTDERISTYTSTVAAAKYLKDLFELYGDWLLVLAAYNSGPGAVNTAIKKSGSRNFWALQRFLPAESRGHVRRFIGVHYHFEGEGSIVTQTKAEAKAWEEQLSENVVVR